ncbi:M16 family metallopeptidase [Candidatus Omnitrophota bacterium]
MNIRKNKRMIKLMGSFFKKTTVVLFLIFFITAYLYTDNVCATSDQFSKKICDNGLTVIVRSMPSSPVVSLYAAVKTGSATEGDLLGSGVSHLLEHMLFKGTHERGVGEIAARVQAMGGSVNASTGKDVTTYKMTLPVEGFDEALDILSDMLMNATLDADELIKEKEVVINEMRLYEDNPDRKISEIGAKTSYLTHPYRHPIIGYKDLFSALSRDDVLAYYREKYVANNMVFSVAGNVDPLIATQKIEAAFASYPFGKISVRNLPQEAQQITPRFVKEIYPTDLSRLEMSFPTVKLLDSDLFALDCLAQLLGQGKSSRLYRDVYKDKNLVYQISSYNHTPVDQGRFVIRAVLEDEKIDEAIAAIKENIERIKNGDVEEDELLKARKQVLKDHIFSQQTAEHCAYSQAVDEIFTGDYHFSDRYVEGIERVTSDEVERLARQYLKDEALSIVVLSSEKKSEMEQPVDAAPTKNLVERIILENGLTILLKEDHAHPIVNMRLLVNGGLRFETKDNNGIFQLMSSLWTKGTKRTPVKKLNEVLAINGIDLTGYSGKNSFGLTVSSLSDDKDKALDVFSETIRQPSFLTDEMEKLKEKQNINIRLREDNIFRLSQFNLKQTLFQTHPYGFDTTGTITSLAQITRQDIVSLYERFVVADNMVLTVFGDFDTAEFLEDVKRAFKDLKAGKEEIVIPEEAAMVSMRERSVEMNKEQAMVLFGFHGVKVDNDDRYGLDVLTSLLGSSFSGRLFNVIREEFGQAYTLGGNSVPGVDMGMIYFYVLTEAQHIEHVQALVLAELKDMQERPILQQELDEMKVYLKGRHKAGLETISSYSMSVGLDELYEIGYQEVDRFDAAIDAVSVEDVMRLAGQYLNLEAYALVVVKPYNN